MASEDSEQFSPGLLAIHCLDDLDDVGKSLEREMMTTLHEFDTASELFKVSLLRRMHRMLAKERNDHVDQIRPSPNRVAIEVLPVVIVPLVLKHLADSEEALQLVQARDALSSLSHRELMRHLIAGPVAASALPASLADKSD